MITIKSPTRVDLAGGTLDLWPLGQFIKAHHSEYFLNRSIKTINLAIDIWTDVRLEKTTDGSVEIQSKDLGVIMKSASVAEFLKLQDPKAKLYQALIGFFYSDFIKNKGLGFKLATESQSPVGGGLGGSSSLMISLLKAFHQLLNLNLPSVHECVQIAHNLEAQVLNTPTGTQDYYPAFSGGLNLLEFTDRGISQNVMAVSGTTIEENFLLVHTGKSHHSGMNNFEVFKRAVAKDALTLKSLFELAQISEATYEVCRAQEWKKLPSLFQQEYEARTRLAPEFSSPEIERLSTLTRSHGAQAIKICGAGGGGCVLVWVSPDFRAKVVEACQKEKFTVLNAKPVQPLKG